jgi:hypothetical protein
VTSSIGVRAKQAGDHEAADKGEQQYADAYLAVSLPFRSGWSSSAQPHQPRTGRVLARAPVRSIVALSGAAWSGGHRGGALGNAVDVGDRIHPGRRHALPGSTMPTRFSGSAAEIVIVSPARGCLRTAPSASTASGIAYCSPLNPLTNLPPRMIPRASIRPRAHNTSRGHGKGLADEQVFEDHTPAGQ